MIMTEEEMDEQIELMQEVTLEEMFYQYGDDGEWLYEQGRAEGIEQCKKIVLRTLDNAYLIEKLWMRMDELKENK